MEHFILSKKNIFILYGAASCGSLICDKLLYHGYTVKGFIDQRAEEIVELKGLPVYSLNHAAEKFNGKDIVILISVKNVFEHSRIAIELAEHGFQNILYKPYAALKGHGTRDETMVEMLYDKLAAGHPLEREYEVKCTTERPNIIHDEKHYIIEEENDHVVVSLPLVCLFEDLKQHTVLQERNVLYFFPHIQFFQYLQGEEKADIRYYIDYCEKAASEIGSFNVTELWRKNVIKNRTEICVEMNNSFYFERDFFVKNAPYVTWNSKGYFNLNSGKHRTAFWASKKMMFMPVKMNKETYEIWMNNKKALHVLETLKRKQIYELKAPIEHPFFYQYSCIGAVFFQGLIFKIAEEISRIYYDSPLSNYVNNKKIYTSVDDLGYLSRFFRRCGAQVYQNKSEDDELIQLLDELFYLEDRNRLLESDEYDIAIIRITEPNWQDMKGQICAQHVFYIVPERLIEKKNALNCIYQGIAWNEKTCVLYQGAEDV